VRSSHAMATAVAVASLCWWETSQWFGGSIPTVTKTPSSPVVVAGRRPPRCSTAPNHHRWLVVAGLIHGGD